MSRTSQVSIDGDCLVEDFPTIPRKRWRALKRKLEEGAAGAQPMQGELRGLYRITLGDYRCVFEERNHAGQLVRHVLAVGPRNTVYEGTEIAVRWKGA
jgi:hypothetical protein